jgi:hypothetical protein
VAPDSPPVFTGGAKGQQREKNQGSHKGNPSTSLILCVLVCRENLTDVWLWGTFVFDRRLMGQMLPRR